MAIADVLEKTGKGLASGLKTAGRAALPVLERTAQVVSGQAPEIDAESRARQTKLEDEEINAKAAQLENQLAIGQKYGTLTPADQQQYVDQISQLYSHPRHAGTLMEKLRKAVHPNGAVATPGLSTLKEATPAGGTAAADEANAEKLAAAKYRAQPKKGFDQFLETYTRENGVDPEQLTEAQLEDAHTKYYQQTHQQMLDKEIVEDSQSPTGFSVSEVDKRSGKVVSSFPGVLPRPGFVPRHRVTYSKDQYGNETMSVSDITPVIGGKPAATGGGATGATPKPAASSAATPKKSTVGGILKGVNPSKPAGVSGVKPVTTPPAIPGGPKQLDQSGHIPQSPGTNEQVRELANELMDGKDLKDIPQKAKAPAADLARQYGWSQGALTPKEKIQVSEAANFLKQLQDSPSLSVLNSDVSRAKIAQVLGKHTGVVGSQLTALTARHLTPEESEFIRQFNAAAGSVSGLSQLTRGGRPVESSINRLLAELPNVLQSSGSADAKARIQNLLKEIDIAKNYRGDSGIGGPAQVLGGDVIVVSPEDLK